MRTLLPLIVLITAPILAGGFNDTGITQCFDGSNLVICSEFNTGDTAAYPRQDARFGRDAAATAGQLTKTGGGAAGFDFTALDTSGNPTLPTSGATPHPCVRDNVTDLIWEVKTDDGSAADKNAVYRYNAAVMYAASVNSAGGLCGYGSGWRLPTNRELLSIVHHGTSDPAIDITYFPNAVAGFAWSSDAYQPDPTQQWVVFFRRGISGPASAAIPTGRVRLVNSGQ